MKNFARYALSSGAALALLAGCGGSQPLIGAPGAMPQSRAIATQAGRGGSSRPLQSPTYSVLFSFDGSDGQTPMSLLSVNGTLYGTTTTGGSGSGPNCFYVSNYGCGTVFSITPSGEEHVLYSFTGVPDGAFPKAGLIDVHGTLYGTTSYGGADNQGTVFSITTSGQEHVLHSFSGDRDGGQPVAPLLDVNGVLYGTTGYGGGRYSSGTVFRITTAGKERVLHRFHLHRDGYAPDGYAPTGGLVDVNGTLYGTTELGGSGDRDRVRRQIVISGDGTVFSIMTTGQERSLYSFTNSPDGARPFPGLTSVDGTLYGTTDNGGNKNCTGGCGTVFSITTSGQEKVLHSFDLGSGGWAPGQGALLKLRGMLYGTTLLGGTGCSGLGCGIVYALTTGGNETVLYRFAGKPDGSYPGGLINVKGTLYGTTGYGGTYGDGTIFSLKP